MSRLPLKSSNPFGGSKRTNTKKRGSAAINNEHITSQPRHLSALEHRRQRLTLQERKVLVKLAFEVLDVNHTGKIEKPKLDDLSAEIAYLVRQCQTEERRERERFMVTHGEDTLNEIEQEEKVAYKASIDLESASDTEEQEDSDLGDFVVPDDEVEYELAKDQPLQLTFISEASEFKRLKKHILIEDYPDPE